MNSLSTEQFPNSIQVFGSDILYVEPDIAQINFGYSYIAPKPEMAFKQARSVVQNIEKYLGQAGIKEVQASHLSMKHEYDYQNRQYIGYKAESAFAIILRDLGRIEEITVGVIEAGANHIQSTNFQVNQLKEHRAAARKKAVAAAREKALLYCEATGTSLGKVLHIEDVNPDTLRNYGGHGSYTEMTNDNEDATKLFSPSSIMVRAAVRLIYALNS